jgi:hypothetical protein
VREGEVTELIGELRPARLSCTKDEHYPGCYNPNSDDTYCVCGEQRWPGQVGTWHSRRAGDRWDVYFLHAHHCADRIVPDEYALEADPGKCTASFPTFDTWEAAQAAANQPAFVRPGLPPPRVVWRIKGQPWRDREPMPEQSHLCGRGDQLTLFGEEA